MYNEIAKPIGRSLSGISLILSFCFFFFTASAQTTWTGAVDTDWHTAGNWSAGVPTSSDEVDIPPALTNYPVLSGDAAIKDVFVQSGATLTVGNSVTLEINGATGAGMEISGTLNNNGIILIGNVSATGSTGINFLGVINNNPGAEIRLDRSTNTSISGFSFGSLINDGIIVIGENASVGSNGIIIQTGAILTNNNEISISNCSNVGLNVGGATYPGVIQNVGLLKFGENGFAGNWAINCFGTITNSTCSSVINIFSNSFISAGGSGNITNNGSIIERATSGSLVTTNNGFIQNLNGGTFTVGSGNAPVTTPGTFWSGCTDSDWNNEENWTSRSVPTPGEEISLINVTNDPLITGIVSVAAINLYAGANLEIAVGGELYLDNASSIALDNYGTVTINGSLFIGNSGTAGDYGIYNNTGGTITNNLGGEIEINGCTSEGIANDGGTINNNGSLTIANLSAVGYDCIIQYGGQFNNSTTGEMYLDRGQVGVYIEGGTFSNSGLMHLGANVPMEYNGIHINSTFTNNASGTIKIENSSIYGMFIDNGVTATNNGTISIGDGGSVLSFGIYAFGNLNNTGTFSFGINGGSIGSDCIWFNISTATFNNTGTFQSENIGGDLIDGLSTHFNLNTGGTLRGTCTINANVLNINGGTIAPGNSPGIMTFNTNEDFSAGILDIEIDGTGTPGTQYDQIVVNGTATLGGTLAATVNYTPVNGDQMTIIDATALSGTFSSVTGLTGWFVNYNKPAAGQVTLSYGAPLPVELVSFTATKKDQGALLQWTTATELNNEGFYIERSRDGINWQSIDFVKGNGASLTTHYYQYLDQEVSAGLYYYRLHQVDFDGSFSFSEIRIVDFSDNQDKISLYPNPAKEYVFITNLQDFSDVSVSVFDLTGKIVFQNAFQNDAQKLQLDLPVLQPGLYLVKINTGRKTVSEKLEVW